ncbi:MAG TPA: class I SAM-dependent methyltransferase [Tepidisphaeraceae bacterium]|jgi:SAM-dependent methyltransferase|nr:class I SAM-dependent methyltransferase [Tepidisphaeraceae bacterium]
MTNPLKNIEAFYDARSEGDRLHQGIGRLEAVRTLELLTRFLPPPPAIIADVGGGTGYYARWLTERGYIVHLLDIVPAHVDAARKVQPPPASATLGDARHLPWTDASADAVLLMGPLYHLKERSDRVRAFSEARRVLRPNGLLFGVVIPRWASTLIGMLRGWTFDDAYAAMVRQEITEGQHLPPTDWPLFMEGFFHNSKDLHDEARAGGFDVRLQAAIEGPAWLSQEFDSAWEDPKKRERILQLARLAEGDPEILAASPHIAFIAGGTNVAG